MNTDTPLNPEQAAALRSTRIRWFITLLVTAPMPFIALPITGSGWVEQTPGPAARNAILFAAVFGLACLVAALYARNQAYKAHWRADLVTPEGYVRGNTAFFVVLTLGVVGVFLISVFGGYPAPTFAGAPIFVGLLAMNFPNGNAMRPVPPRIGGDGDGL